MNNPLENKLLKSLVVAEYECIIPHLELIQMPLGKVIFESGEKLQYLYFPTDCFVSLLSDLENGSSTEIALVGNEGAAGIAIFLSGTSIYRAVIQSPGYAYRMRKDMVIQEFNKNRSFFYKLLKYTQALVTHTAQTAVCNRFHTLNQRLCRLLLLILDRLPANELTITQESIANMLGVRREGVTEAAGKLQKAGLIHYTRGHITVLDRSGLEACVCECYQVVKKESNRLLAA